MLGYTIGNSFVYAVVNAITPRPGDILAPNTVGSYGWKRGRPLFFGIFVGYYMIQILYAVFVFGVSASLPNVLRVMKYIGATYVSWFTIHIVTDESADDSSEKSASFTKGFLLQFANVKMYLFGIAVLINYIMDHSISFSTPLVTEPTIATIGTIAALTRIDLGTLLRTAYQKYYRPIDIVLALTLLECIYSMLK